MADLADLREAVATFAGALTALAVRLAAVEAALGVPRAPAPAVASVAPEVGGDPASDADVARLQTVLDAYGDARASLERRIATLEQALAAFAPALRRAPLVAVAGVAPSTAGTSRADLDRIQKQTVACAALLADLELRTGAAEDALDAFFGTVR